jgi:2-polyprenyl-3-methyl-5-hydroxy-6-metoxy-1,4-benzoquinol methylase
MKFYQEIAKYYEHIFPVAKAPIQFLKEHLTSENKTILDIACGNGAYAIELAKEGYMLTAIDATDEMVQSAAEKAALEGCIIETKTCNMRELTKHLQGPYGGVFCIGNSLVHLDELIEVEEALWQMNALLGEGGIVILQIINYDRIIQDKVSSLPTIENKKEGLTFVREYTHDLESDRVLFHTTLKVKEEELSHTTKLLPITSDVLAALVEKTNFEVTHLYGDFKKEPYNKNTSYHTIVIAQKKANKSI